MQFLMGLHDSFITARGQILMMTPLPSVTQAYSLIKQDEKQRQGYNHNNANLVALGFLHNHIKRSLVLRSLVMMMEEQLRNVVTVMELTTLGKLVLS